MSKIRTKLLIFPYVLWITIFSIVPILVVISYSITDSNSNFTLDNFIEIKDYSCAFVRSIVLSIISTIICFLIGYPTAYAISKLKKKSQRFIIAGIILQMWISSLLITYSLMTLLESNGIINRFFTILGKDGLTLINTKIAVVIGLVYDSLTYMILPIYSSLSRIDSGLIEAAKDLGANKVEIFKKIIFPLSLPGVFSGFIMIFAPSMSTFIVSKMLGGNENILIGEIIELKFLGNEFNPWSGSSIALSLMFIIMICNGIMNNLIYKNLE